MERTPDRLRGRSSIYFLAKLMEEVGEVGKAFRGGGLGELEEELLDLEYVAREWRIVIEALK